MKQFIHTLAILLSFLFTDVLGQPATNVVISQVYGGGGNVGAPYLNDYIELFNPTSSPVDLTGWSVQYAAATGSSWGVTPLSGIIAPGSYFLIQQSSGGVNGIPLPTPDATDNTSMAATAGKILLCNAATAFVGICPTAASIVDFVGYGTTANCFEGTGPAPAPSNTTAVFRADSGCTDSNYNGADFSAAAPAPRNSASPTHACAPTGVFQSTTTENEILIYPNPVLNQVSVIGCQFSEKGTIEIYDVLGNLILGNSKKTISQQHLTLDVSDLISGVYFIRINEGKYFRQTKFVKE